MRNKAQITCFNNIIFRVQDLKPTASGQEVSICGEYGIRPDGH